MKAFNKLTIGDKFWRVYTNYEGHDKPKFKEIVVNRVEVDGEFFIINYHRDFRQPILVAEQSVINCDDGFYTTDYGKLTEGLRLAALKYIKEHEDQIRLHQMKIQSVREAYFEYLSNPLIKEPLLTT